MITASAAKSATAKEKKDDPQTVAPTSTAASVSISSVTKSATADQQKDDPHAGIVSVSVSGRFASTSASTVCCT